MTIHTTLVPSSWMKLGAGCLLLWVLAPVISSAQQTPDGATSFDFLQAHLNEQTDRILSELKSGAQPERIPLIRVERDAAMNMAAETIGSSSLPRLGAAPLSHSVDEILRRQGLPAQLISVVAVESGFKPWALSPKGALGLWQLMPDTARRYGLVVNNQRDDRRDPSKSTTAAAQYLKDLYGQFGNWLLTLAAYNAGEKRVQNAVDRFGTRDFWTLSARLALPDETRRYVPAVLSKLGGERGLLSLEHPVFDGLKQTGPSDVFRSTGPAVQGQIVFATNTPAPSVGARSN
jgi:soluble lytic murein transglycosylase-like protein